MNTYTVFGNGYIYFSAIFLFKNNLLNDLYD